MDDKTGIFTFRELIEKTGSSGRIENDRDWARDAIAYQARQTIIARLVPGRMYVIAITALHEDEGALDIRMEQKVLIALSDWTEADVGDCVVGEEDFLEARRSEFRRGLAIRVLRVVPDGRAECLSTTAQDLPEEALSEVADG